MEQLQLSYQLDMEKESVWLTVTASQAARASFPFIQEIGDFITHKRYFTKRSGLASYLIKYTLSGRGVLEYDGEIYEVQPGQIFYIDCMKPQHYYTSPAVGEWRMLWIHFYGETCKAYYELFRAYNSGGPVVSMPPHSDLPARLRELKSLYETGESSIVADMRASGLLARVMSECCLAALSEKEHAGLPDCVQAARAYLLHNYYERITLDDLSRRYSINKYYFQKLFKKHTGFTPNEFLILARLNHSKELLRTTNLPISQVAERVGVDNPSHFINLFKKHEGITPNAYRLRWYR